MNNPTLSPTQLKQAIVDIFKINLCAMITGSPGIGKSDIINAVAKEYKLFVIDMRLSQMEPTELD
jgi:MoxR-like ATPase